LFPLVTHPDFAYSISEFPQYLEIVKAFNNIAKQNRNTNGSQIVRLSTHPDQFNVLASENADSVEKTIRELNHHGWIMDMLECERSYQNPINIHVNCTKGNVADIASRFMENLSRCDESVTSRLVVENEDKGCWTVKNLLDNFNIPVTYDNLHHKCNPSYFDADEKVVMFLCSDTWGNYRPVFHYSESHPNKPNPRSHADMPTNCPPAFDADFDIELKFKDIAIRAVSAIELTQLSQELNMGY
jgi:UV DNA damage endonuclease